MVSPEFLKHYTNVIAGIRNIAASPIASANSTVRLFLGRSARSPRLSGRSADAPDRRGK